MNGFILGIPSKQTQRIIPVSRFQTALYEIENQEAFISVPILFQLKDLSAPHGLVLKSIKPFKTVLLTPRIENELEIPDDKMQSLPDALHGIFKFFKGACFNGENLILFLDPIKLIESMND